MFDIRPFTDSDRNGLRNIYLAARLQALPWVSRTDLAEEDFDKDTRDEELLVATINTLPVGFIALNQSGDVIHHLYVDPDSSGRGVGSALLNASLERLGRPAHLKCLIDNERAVEFYRQRGWAITGEGEDRHGRYYTMALKEH